MIKTTPYTADVQGRLAPSFDCGNAFINVFLKGTEALDHGLGATYIFLSDDADSILGFFNIGVNCIRQIEEQQTVFMGGSVHINEFAIHKDLQGKAIEGTGIRFSEYLFQQCINVIMELRNKVGFSFITLAANTAGERLYKRMGFEFLDEDMAFDRASSEISCVNMYRGIDWEY